MVTGSTYPITSSWSISSSYSLTASYSLNSNTSTKEQLWIPASAMIPQFTGGPEAITQEFQSGSASGSANISLDGWLFDPVIQESINITAKFPSNFDSSSLSVQFYWTTLTGSSGDVEWAICQSGFNNESVLKVSLMTTTSSILQSLSNSASLYITPELSTIAFGDGYTTSSLIQFNILRNVQTDTFGFDAVLIGSLFKYNLL